LRATKDHVGVIAPLRVRLEPCQGTCYSGSCGRYHRTYRGMGRGVPKSGLLAPDSPIDLVYR